MKSQPTFGAILKANRGVGPGFDFLRIALAVVIFYSHVRWTTRTDSTNVIIRTVVGAREQAADVVAWTGWERAIIVSFVPAFFALSGYLVSASAVRTNVTQTFLAHRGLRIFPALIVEVTLSAILLGVFFTTLPLGEFFTHPQFWRYTLNALGFVTFYLPGVFEANPVKGIVNANLWTLPAEFYCYLIIAALIATSIFYRRTLFTGVVIVLCVAGAIGNGFFDFAVPYTLMPTSVVVFYFFGGALFYHWKDHIPMHWGLFLVAGVVGYLLQSNRNMVFLAVPFVIYATLFVGHLRIPRIPLLQRGDYSYGMYLYGFPITQATIAAFPSIADNRWAVLALAGLGTMAFAIVSWHIIEKPLLAYKKKLPSEYFPASREVVPQTPKSREKVVESGA